VYQFLNRLSRMVGMAAGYEILDVDGQSALQHVDIDAGIQEQSTVAVHVLIGKG